VSMGKRILGWLRQRCVGVAYGAVWCLWLIPSAFCFWKTLMTISDQVDETHVWSVWMIYCLPLLFLMGFIVVRQILYWWRKAWQQSRPVLTMRLILVCVFVLIFLCMISVGNGIGLGFYIGKGNPEPGLVSLQEVGFIFVLFWVGALFQCVMIEFEDRREEMNKVVGGILIIMGIIMPELLKSWSILGVYCGKGSCTSHQLEFFVPFKMGIAYAVGLSVMFVVGLFSEPVIGFFRSFEEEVSVVSRESSPAGSHNAEVLVPASEVATASDAQNDGVELAPGSSSATTCVPQEAADGASIPAQATEVLANACGSGGAVSKQLMSAAVSGVVAGVCFSVVSRLFDRR